ncbi:MAG: hypothetical protein PHD21_08730, partial [Flavobacteriales bacterium]|nr:hypothetical protein [Flavobacteriales bacterium]
MKKIMLIVCAVLLLSACNTEKEKTTEQISVDAIPVGTMAICRIKQHSDVSAMLEKSMYIQCFDSLKSKNTVASGAGLTRSICGKKYSSAPMTIAVGAVRAKELSFIFMIETGKDAPRTTFGADTTITHRTYQDQNIYSVSTKDASVFFYNTNGMTICSTDELYLEQSLLQTSSGISIADDASFSQAYKKLSSGDGFTVIVNLPALEHFYTSQIGFAELGLLGQLSPWLSAEVTADSTTLSLSGVFCASDSVKTYAKVLSNQKSKEMTLDAFFPSNTTSYTYLGIEDWKKYFKENIQYLKASSQYHLYNVALQRYNVFFGNDFDKFFTPWIGKGAAVVRSSGAGYNDTQNSIFIGVKDHDEAMAALEKIADSTSVNPDPYLDHRIIPLDQKTI